MSARRPEVPKRHEQAREFRSRFTPPIPVATHKSKTPAKKPHAKIDESEQKLASQRELARQRAALGFDDIPVASAAEVHKEEEKRERVGKWAKKTYKKQFSAEKRQQVVGFFKNKGYLRWKEDLEWAMKADRDDPEVKQPTPEATPQLTPRRTDQRRIRVPERGQQSVKQPVAATQQPVASASTTTNSHKTIDINISFGALPKLPKPKLRPAAILARIKRIRWNRRMQITSGLFAVVLIATAGYIVVNAQNHPKTFSTTTAETPTYQTIAPSNKPSGSLKWQRVSPPSSDPVFAYADTIDGISIFVSQQPIPDSFQPNVDDKVAQLAASYTATDKISAGSTPVYVGTSAQGPQSVIFSKNNLLVLIKSAGKISDDAWTSYANSLQ